MVLIGGVEITKNSLSNSRSAHVLALNINEWISPDQSIDEILCDIRHAGGISIAAHPVFTGKLEPQTFHIWDRRHELRDHIDLWEVASGPVLFEEVRQSGLPLVASSDLHHPRQMNSWKTVLACEKHKDAILEALIRQQVDFEFYSVSNEVFLNNIMWRRPSHA